MNDLEVLNVLLAGFAGIAWINALAAPRLRRPMFWTGVVFLCLWLLLPSGTSPEEMQDLQDRLDAARQRYHQSQQR